MRVGSADPDKVVNLVRVGDLTVVGLDDSRLAIFSPTKKWFSQHKVSMYCLSARGKAENDHSRVCKVAGRRLYFSKAEEDWKGKRGRIVQVNLDTFEERVLDKLKENIADFLVDENQTITYLTSQGELIQENVDNNTSIPRTCVNLKENSPDAVSFHSLCQVSPNTFLASAYCEAPQHKNRFLLSSKSTQGGFKVHAFVDVPVPAEVQEEDPDSEYAGTPRKLGLNQWLSASPR